MAVFCGFSQVFSFPVSEERKTGYSPSFGQAIFAPKF
jgi:hypothetical protein